jgi:AhpD family alkylhydroperoxidase
MVAGGDEPQAAYMTILRSTGEQPAAGRGVSTQGRNSTRDSDPRGADGLYPAATADLAQHRKQLVPDTHDAFQAFSRQVFADGALQEKAKQLIAVAVAHVTQCPYCIRAHVRAAQRSGASEQEIMEAIWVAAEMRAGGAYAHSLIALDAMHQHADG